MQTLRAATVIILLALALPSYAETVEFTCGIPVEHAGPALYPMPSGGLWGFVDAAGDWVIEPAYERVTDFSEGRAVVAEVDGYWGVIDEEGEWIHEPSLASQSYSELGERRIHTPPLQPYSEGCSAGVGATSSDPPFFLDRSGNKLWEYDPPAALANEEVLRYGSFSEGKAWFQVFSMDFGGDHGFINAAGSLVLPALYGWAGEFREGLAPAETPEQEAAFIGVTGEPVIPTKWTFYGAEPFSGGLALVRTGPFDLAYIRSTGDWAFMTVTDPASGEEWRILSGGAFSEGLALLEVEVDDAPLLVYADEVGNLAFVPSDVVGGHLCGSPSIPGFGQFRNGLARLMVVSEPAICDEVYPWAELADYEGVEYVYVDLEGRVVLP